MTKTYDVRFTIKRTYVYDYLVDAESVANAVAIAERLHISDAEDHCVDEETTDWDTLVDAR